MADFALTQGSKDVEWFDTMEAARTAHQQKPQKYLWYIIVYAFSRRICTIIYSPHLGYFNTGNVDVNGVDLIKEYHLEEAIFGKDEVA